MKRLRRKISERADAKCLEKQIEDQLQQQLREMDRQYTERLCKRYRHLVPPERIRAMKDLPTVFEDRKRFEQSYRRVTSTNPAENVVGFSHRTEMPAHVATDHLQMRKTIIHERLHQLADPASDRLLGKRIDEGITEDLAIRELGQDCNNELPRSYTQERAAAQKLRELCGDGAVDLAYFQGDTRELRTCLDGRLGKSNLKRFENMAARSDSVIRSPEETDS